MSSTTNDRTHGTGTCRENLAMRPRAAEAVRPQGLLPVGMATSHCSVGAAVDAVVVMVAACQGARLPFFDTLAISFYLFLILFSFFRSLVFISFLFSHPFILSLSLSLFHCIFLTKRLKLFGRLSFPSFSFSSSSSSSDFFGLTGALKVRGTRNSSKQSYDRDEPSKSRVINKPCPEAVCLTSPSSKVGSLHSETMPRRLACSIRHPCNTFIFPWRIGPGSARIPSNIGTRHRPVGFLLIAEKNGSRGDRSLSSDFNLLLLAFLESRSEATSTLCSRQQPFSGFSTHTPPVPSSFSWADESSSLSDKNEHAARSNGSPIVLAQGREPRRTNRVVRREKELAAKIARFIRGESNSLRRR